MLTESDIIALTTLNYWGDFSDASKVTTVSGNVSSLADKSAAGLTFTQATSTFRPAYVSSVYNGLNIARFNGTTHRLTRGSSALGRNKTGVTIFTVRKSDGATGANQGIFAATTPNSALNRLYAYLGTSAEATGGGRTLDADSFGGAGSGPVASGLELHVVEFDYANTDARVYINKILEAQNTSYQSATATSNTDAAVAAIGAASTGSTQFFDGDIGEIIVLGEVNATLREQISDFLGVKWGLWNPKLEYLVDDFSSGDVDTDIWSTYEDTGTEVNASTDELVMTIEADIEGVCEIGTIRQYDFEDSYMRWQLKQFNSAGIDRIETGQNIIDGNGDVLGIGIVKTGGTTSIVSFKIISSTLTQVDTLTYNPDVHRFFRIIEDTGDAVWEYSTDGITWTELHSETCPIEMDEVDAFIYTVGLDGIGTHVESSSIVDNINILNKYYDEDLDAGAVGGAELVKSAQKPIEVSINGSVDLGVLTFGGEIVRRGFVYDTVSRGYPGNIAPEASDYANVEDESGDYGVGFYDLTIGSLSPGTTYYIRAFAENSDGDFGYGEELTFKTVFDTQVESFIVARSEIQKAVGKGIVARIVGRAEALTIRIQSMILEAFVTGRSAITKQVGKISEASAVASINVRKAVGKIITTIIKGVARIILPGTSDEVLEEASVTARAEITKVVGKGIRATIEARSTISRLVEKAVEIVSNIAGTSVILIRRILNRSIEASIEVRSVIETARVVILNATMSGRATITTLFGKSIRAGVQARIKLRDMFFRTKYRKQNDDYGTKYVKQDDDYKRKY